MNKNNWWLQQHAKPAFHQRGHAWREAGKINFPSAGLNLGPSAGLNLGPSAGLNLGQMGHMGKQYIRVYAASAYKYTYKRNVYIYVYTRRADYGRGARLQSRRGASRSRSRGSSAGVHAGGGKRISMPCRLIYNEKDPTVGVRYTDTQAFFTQIH